MSKTISEYLHIKNLCDCLLNKETRKRMTEEQLEEIRMILDLPQNFFAPISEYTVHSEQWFQELMSALKPYKEFFKLLKDVFSGFTPRNDKYGFLYLTEETMRELKENKDFFKFEHMLPGEQLTENEKAKFITLLEENDFTYSFTKNPFKINYCVHEDEYSKRTYKDVYCSVESFNIYHT